MTFLPITSYDELEATAKAASDGSCAKVMAATLDFHACNTAFGIE